MPRFLKGDLVEVKAPGLNTGRQGKVMSFHGTRNTVTFVKVKMTWGQTYLYPPYLLAHVDDQAAKKPTGE